MYLKYWLLLNLNEKRIKNDFKKRMNMKFKWKKKWKRFLINNYKKELKLNLNEKRKKGN